MNSTRLALRTRALQTAEPRQLMIPLETVKLAILSGPEREKAIGYLANVFMQAANVEGEHDDVGR